MIASMAATTIPLPRAVRHRRWLTARGWTGRGWIIAALGALALTLSAQGAPPVDAAASPPSSPPPPSTLPTVAILYPVQEPQLFFDPATGTAAGSLYDFTQALARKAGITLRWEAPRSRRRVLAEMESRTDPVCTVNIAKTPERAAKFKYTAPVSIAPDWVILVRTGDTRIDYKTSVAELRRRPDLILGLPDGSFIENLIDVPEPDAPPGAPQRENREKISGSPMTLLAMLAKKRVDYIPYDANTLEMDRTTLGLPADTFRMIRVPEFNFIGQGYMACGQGTPDAIIDRLNRAAVATGLYTFN